MPRQYRIGAILLLLGMVVTPLCARSSSKPANCDGEAYRQFDFWLGDWEVRNPKGDLVGTNLVEQEGCALMEHWKSNMETGISLNVYDAVSKEWSQTWVDSTGSVLHLRGRGQRER
jgi:hypothetical protein